MAFKMFSETKQQYPSTFYLSCYYVRKQVGSNNLEYNSIYT